MRWARVLRCCESRAPEERRPRSTCTVHGLFDGERIAGSVMASDAANEPGEEVGEFLCTRLFSFWGTPQPKAAQGKDMNSGDGDGSS